MLTELAHDVLALTDLMRDGFISLAHRPLLLLKDPARVVLNLVGYLLRTLQLYVGDEVNQFALESRGANLRSEGKERSDETEREESRAANYTRDEPE